MRKRKTDNSCKEKKEKLQEERYYEKYGVHESDIVENKKKFKIKYAWKMLGYLKGNFWSLALLVFLILIAIGIGVLQPIAIAQIIDYAVLGDWDTAFIYVLVLASTLLLGPLWFVFDIVKNKLNAKVRDKMRMDMVDATSRLKVSYFDKVDSGTILSRLNGDPTSFMNSFYNVLAQIRLIITDFSKALTIFVISWKIGVVIFASCVILYLANTIFNRKYMIPAVIRDEKINDMYNSATSEMVRGIRDIKNLNILSHFYNKFKKVSIFKTNSYVDTSTKSAVNENVFGWHGLYNVFTLLIIALGVYYASQGQMSIGQLSLVISSSSSAFSLATRFAYTKSYIMRMEISAKRMNELLDSELNPREQFGDIELKDIKGEIAFENVSFSYNDEKVFDDLNLLIKSGECVGFVGRSGEGKSTVLNLIPRLYDVNEGKITIDGVDVRDLTDDTLRNGVSIVSQSPYIFNMSILENLRLVKPDATDEEICEACEKASIWEFIQSKPDGLNTKVGEGGVVLSGGQRQRLAIARAFLKGSPILLLDEATSALDNESQAEVKKAISNMQKTCTIVIVAHRLSTVRDCDKIFVLQDHKIVGVGTHKELSKTCKEYKNLYEQEEN